MGNNAAKKFKLLTDDLVTIRSQQNKRTTESLKELVDIKEVSSNYPQATEENVDTTENTDDDVEIIDDMQESLKEINETLEEINDNGFSKETLDNIKIITEEEHSIKSINYEIPRFDFQDLIQGFENNEVIELIDSDDMHSPDELVLAHFNLKADNIHGPTENTGHSIDIKTNVHDAETISISSEDSQAHEHNLKPEENIDDEPNNVNNEKDESRNVNNENDEPITNIFIDDSDNVCEIKDEKRYEPKNVDGKYKKIDNEPKNVHEENEEVRVLDDSDNDCGYHSSDFEFITEDEAKMDGLITFKSEILKNKVKKHKKIKTIEIAVDQSSGHNSKIVNPGPINNVQGNIPELFCFNGPIGSGTSLTQTAVNSKNAELKKSSTESMQGNLPETNSSRHELYNFQPNGSSNVCSNLRKFRIIRTPNKPNSDITSKIQDNSDSSHNLQIQNIINNQRYDPVIDSDLIYDSGPGFRNFQNCPGLRIIGRFSEPTNNSGLNFRPEPIVQGNVNETSNYGPDFPNLEGVSPGSSNIQRFPELANNSGFNVGPEPTVQGNVLKKSNYGPGFPNLQRVSPGSSNIQRFPEPANNSGLNVGPVPIVQGNVNETNNYGPDFPNLEGVSPGSSNIQRFPEPANNSGLNVGPVPIVQGNVNETSNYGPDFPNLEGVSPGSSNIQRFPELANNSGFNVGPEPTVQGNVLKKSNYGPGFPNLQRVSPGSSNIQRFPEPANNSGLNVGPVPIVQGNVNETNNYGPDFPNLEGVSPGSSNIQRFPEPANNSGLNVGPVPIVQGNVNETSNYGPDFPNLEGVSPGSSNIQRFPEPANNSGLNVDPVPIVQGNVPETSNYAPRFRNVQGVFPETSNGNFPKVPDPRIARWRAFQERNRNQFVLDYSYRDNHRMLHGDDYYSLFDPNLNPLPLCMRQMENKSIRSTSMLYVEYDGIGFDMRMMEESGSEEDEVKEEADESAQIILEMYPGVNIKRPRRRF